MSEPIQVVWNKIPLVGLPELACALPVNEAGEAVDADGEPLPMEARPNKCGEDGYWMVGSFCLCERHAAEVAEMMGDNLTDIFDAWKALL